MLNIFLRFTAYMYIYMYIYIYVCVCVCVDDQQTKANITKAWKHMAFY